MIESQQRLICMLF